MNANADTLGNWSRWSTASVGQSSRALATSSGMEPPGLGDHLLQCRALRSRFFPLQCALEAVHGFWRTHVFTSAVLVALVVGVGAQVV